MMLPPRLAPSLLALTATALCAPALAGDFTVVQFDEYSNVNAQAEEDEWLELTYEDFDYRQYLKITAVEDQGSPALLVRWVLPFVACGEDRPRVGYAMRFNQGPERAAVEYPIGTSCRFSVVLPQPTTGVALFVRLDGSGFDDGLDERIEIARVYYH